MSVAESASLHTLPVLRLTKVSACPGPGFLPVDHQIGGGQVKYWREPVVPERAERWKTFAKLPLVLNADGTLWEPACLYLLDRAEARPLRLSSLSSVAQGLRDYKVFLDDLGLDWRDFGSVDKYARPTYLYHTHLQHLIDSGKIAESTAGRRMSTVIGLYRFLTDHTRMGFEPSNEPWVEKRFGLKYRDTKGFSQVRIVASTDVSIRASKRDDAWDQTIADGGKLRPLSVEEQRCLIAALKKRGNREYELMHYVSLLTGARVQTVLTLRWGYFQVPPGDVKQWPFKLRCGPGTAIDTKRDVANVYLSIPRELYEWLHVYAKSDRAKRRRAKSRLGEDASNYLFLTSQGSPYYESKEDRNAVRSSDELQRRSSAIGQSLREFLSEKVVPEMQKTLPNFRYKFHDLRATFGMNWVDHNARKEGGKEQYMWVRDELRKLLWHKDAIITDRYLDYRKHQDRLEQAQTGWNEDLVNLIRSA